MAGSERSSVDDGLAKLVWTGCTVGTCVTFCNVLAASTSGSGNDGGGVVSPF